MKRLGIPIIFILFYFTIYLFSFNLSPKLRKIERSKKVIKGVSSIKPAQTKEEYVSVIIRTNNVMSDYKFLKQLGGLPHSIIKNYITAHIPVTSLSELKNRSSIQYIKETQKKSIKLDLSKEASKVDKLLNGTNLSKKYKGKNVIVGIVDSGIDFSHDDFKDPVTGKTRILFLWDQTNNNGDGPEEIENTYGTEWTAEDIDAGNCNQNDDHGHGTHVSGIAAGNGSAVNDFCGMAPEADIIFVKTDFEHDVDGVNYIFKKAESLGKPAVVNMSLGGHFGPHDGTSNYEQSLNNLVGKGKILVAAAGNEGVDKIHFKDEAVSTVKYVDFELFDIEADIEIWYDNVSNDKSINFTFEIISAYDTLLNTIGPVTPGSYAEIDIDYPEDGVSDESINYITIDAEEVSNINNGAALISIYYSNEYGDTLRIKYQGNTEFNMWMSTNGLVGEFKSGDTYSTIGAPGTVWNAITVGSYTTKSQWTDFYGSTHYQSEEMGWQVIVNDISAFSSRGPTRRIDLTGIKPEVTAPGEIIFSASSSDANQSTNDKDSSGKYVKMEGTSMATPAVTGISALLLSVNPNLTPYEIENILFNTSVTDTYVGVFPNNDWGYGKIDAYAALLETIKRKYNFTIKQDTISSNENWTDSIYIRTDLYITDNSELTINKNTKIYIEKNCGIYIDSNAVITVNGTADQPVIFTVSPEVEYETETWKGLLLNDAFALVDNCIISYADTGIAITNSNCTITNSFFNKNNSGIKNNSSNLKIEYSLLSGNSSNGLEITGIGKNEVNHLTIVSNGIGIIITDTKPELSVLNTIIAYNTGYGILAETEPVEILYNDFYLNTLGNYSGIADKTGINGNISVIPVFMDTVTVRNDFTNYKLDVSSPLKFSGSDSSSIGLFQYITGTIDSSDLNVIINKIIETKYVEYPSYNNVVMSMLISSYDVVDTLTEIIVSNAGTMPDSNLLSVKLWIDKNVDGEVSVSDSLAVELSNISSKKWSIQNLNLSLDNYFLITVDLDTNSECNSFFQAEIESYSCSSQLKTGPKINVINSGGLIAVSQASSIITVDTSLEIPVAIINPNVSKNIIDFDSSTGSSAIPEKVKIFIPSITSSGAVSDTIELEIEFAVLDAPVRLEIKNNSDSNLNSLISITGAVNSVSTFSSSYEYNAGLRTVREFNFTRNGIDFNSSDNFENIIITYNLPDELKNKSVALYLYNESDYQWELINESDEIFSDTISFRLEHFSIYGLFVKGSAIKSNLSQIVVFPNPFRPNDGNPETGIRFNGSYNISNKTGVHIKGLTENSIIQIYTLSGEKVSTVYPINNQGMAIWNGRNNDNNEVASGVYLMLIKNGNEHKVEKLMIIR